MTALFACALALSCLPAIAAEADTRPSPRQGEAFRATGVDRTALLTTHTPWEHWKSDAGYPLDRRLVTVVSVSQANISLGALLSALQEQTGVELSAFEPGLQKQELTVCAAGLPLNAAMVQMAQLLGLYWYQCSVDQETEYVVSYGSSPPSLLAHEMAKAQDTRLRQLLASRIDEYIRALSLGEEELRALAKSDPMLAGAMLRFPPTRYGAEALAEFRPETLRKLIEGGRLLVGVDDLPEWFERGLRDQFDPETMGRQGIPSEEDFVRQFRLLFFSRKPSQPEDGIAYDLQGAAWPGLNFVAGVLARRAADAEQSADVQQPEGYPEGFDAFSYLPFEEGQPTRPGGGWLPGRMEDTQLAEMYFPDLVGEEAEKPLGDRSAQLLVDKGEQRELQVSQSPWSNDERLSQLPTFTVTRQIRVSELLSAVAGQTGYAVVATYFDERDERQVDGLSTEEPIFMLLNRAADAAHCSWVLKGNVIRWLHDDWYVFEANRAASK